MRKSRLGMVIAISTLAAALLLWGLRQHATGEEKRYVQVTVDGRQVVVVPLNNTTLAREFTVRIPRGEATIQTRGGKVRVLPMPREICPRGICSETGWVSRPGEAIICLPNRMVVTIVVFDDSLLLKTAKGVNRDGTPAEISGR